MRKLKSVNPSNYQVLGKVEVSSRAEVEYKVKLARRAQKEWAGLGLYQRIKLLRKALAEFAKRKSDLSLLVSREMGMPINEAQAIDYQGAADFANWYFDNAEKHLSPETTHETETEIHQVYYEPIGVSAIIIPWNYPFLNFIWSSFQCLIAGNTIVLKHSEECPLSGRLIEKVMSKHLPRGVFNEVYGDGKIGEMLMRQNIDRIGFVGSCKTGRPLYKIAGEKFIRAVVELGGSAPGIVFDDADIDAAVKSICEYRLSNCGQYCDGLKRLIVHKKVFGEVVGKVASAFSAKKIGMAEDTSTELGPLVAKRQLDLLVQQVEDAKTKGVRIITGGHSLEPKLNGAFHEATILTNITMDMSVWNEEVFGPVLPVVKFSTEDEAIKLANNTDYGLGGYVYTRDAERAMRVARAIQSGMVSISGANYTTPWNPFGGYKNSGLGREHGKWGFHEVTQPKTVARYK